MSKFLAQKSTKTTTKSVFSSIRIFQLFEETAGMSKNDLEFRNTAEWKRCVLLRISKKHTTLYDCGKRFKEAAFIKLSCRRPHWFFHRPPPAVGNYGRHGGQYYSYWRLEGRVARCLGSAGSVPVGDQVAGRRPTDRPTDCGVSSLLRRSFDRLARARRRRARLLSKRWIMSDTRRAAIRDENCVIAAAAAAAACSLRLLKRPCRRI